VWPSRLWQRSWAVYSAAGIAVLALAIGLVALAIGLVALLR